MLLLETFSSLRWQLRYEQEKADRTQQFIYLFIYLSKVYGCACIACLHERVKVRLNISAHYNGDEHRRDLSISVIIIMPLRFHTQ